MTRFNLLLLNIIAFVAVSATNPVFRKEKLLLTERDFVTVSPALKSTISGIKKAAVAKSIPYLYSFEQTNLVNITADGWASTDASSKTGLTNNTSYGLIPEGDYWVYSNYDDAAPRNAWLFSPDFNLSAGITYFVSLYVYAPGWNTIKDEFKITAGNAQTAVAQTNIVADYTGTNAGNFSEWTKVTGTFTPTTTGTYYFGINHCTPVAGGNLVGFDAFTVKDNSDYILPPYVKIYNKGGLWSYATGGDVYLSPDEEMGFMALVKYTESVRWSFPSLSSPASSEDKEVFVSLAAAGSNETNIEASGQGGTGTDKSTINVIYPANSIVKDVYNLKPTDKYITNNSISTFQYDYGLGMNSYWRKIAEKFSIPSNVEVKMNAVSVGVAAYAMQSANASKAVKIGIYPVATDGYPSATAIAEYTTTFNDLFGTGATTLKTYTLPSALTIKGSFFVVLDFSSFTAAVSSTDRLGIYRAASRFVEDNTAYVYYSAGSAWKSFKEVVGERTAAYIIPKLTFTTPVSGFDVVNDAIHFTATQQNDGIKITNAPLHGRFMVSDLSGKLLYSGIVNEPEFSIQLSLNKGVYLLKAGDQRLKFMVK